MDDLTIQAGTSSKLCQALCFISKPRVNSNWSYRVEIGDCFAPFNLKFDGWHWKTIMHLFYTTSSFHSHRSIQTGVPVRKRPIRVKIDYFLSRTTLKFDRRPWKTIRHLFYDTSSFLHYFTAICEFKLELQSGNAQFGLKSAIFCPVWTWNLTDNIEKQKGTSSMLLQALRIIS